MPPTEDAAKPERVALRIALSGALDTDELSLEHDTLVVSVELTARVAESLKTVLGPAPAREQQRNGVTRRSQ